MRFGGVSGAAESREGPVSAAAARTRGSLRGRGVRPVCSGLAEDIASSACGAVVGLSMVRNREDVAEALTALR